MVQGDALSTHIFGLQLGQFKVADVREITGVPFGLEVVEVPMTTSEGKRVIRKQPGGRKAGEITVTRGLAEDKEFTKWVNLSVMEGNVEQARQNITVEYKDSTSKTGRRIQLMNAWASEWEGPSADASQSAAATEKVTIVYEDVKIE